MRPAAGRVLPLALAAVAYGLALWQRPGKAAADTKIDLHTDPVGFLSDVASVWSSSGGLGQVQAGQYAGYLFPMGPFHAAGDLLGLEPWLVQRLWLGTLLAVGAWGAVRLIDALLPGPRGAAHLVAGVLMLLNPYVVLFVNRTSVTLLGLVAVPWLLLMVHRGAREPHAWLWPAAIALVLASTGGGVNAAVTAWILPAPILLLVYEVWAGVLSRRDAVRFAARSALLSVLASLWWIVPVAEHARYGLNFLPFTESVGAIWTTTSLTESLRGLGYWIGYLGTGFGERPHPYFDSSGTLLFDLPVVVATLLVPALALGGYVLIRRLRHAPYLLGLALVGTLIAVSGFPDGTPMRRALTFAYYELEPIQFLRTTHKAAALVVVAVALLGGLAAGELWGRLAPRRVIRGAAVALAGLLIVVSAWPLVRGEAIDERVAYDEIPAAWTATARDIERELPRAARTLVLPGQPFPSYRWGNPQDPILPALTDRPVATRTTVPYADLHAADLLVTVDSLVQQRRVAPGQLRPLAELIGARAVVAGTDDDLDRSGAVEPAVADRLLRQGGLGRAVGEQGAIRRFRPPAGEPGPGVGLPEVRRYHLPRARAAIRVEPRRGELVVDGSAAALAGLAAFGELPRARAISYAADRSPAELRRAAAAGADLVVSDTNRRRVFVASTARRNYGATLGADDPLSRDGTLLNPFADRGVTAQTVMAYDGGVSYVRAPFSPHFPQYPEYRPYSAFDGSAETWWRADRNLDDDRHWVEIGLTAPRTVDHIDVLPRADQGAAIESVRVAGRSYAVRAGWNRLPVRLGRTSKLRVEIASVRGSGEGAGSLAEIRVPGLRVRERPRPPRVLTGAVRGQDLDRSSLSFLFARDTGDDPMHREAGKVEDPERELARTFELPVARRFRVEGLVSLAPEAPDPSIDRLTGYRGDTIWRSSGRLGGVPGRRASRAFDGDRRTAWMALRRGAWIGWQTPRPLRLRAFRIEAPDARVGAPTVVRLRHAGGLTRALRVSAAGDVVLPRPVRSRRFRVEILASSRPKRGSGRAPGAVGIAELRVPGLRAPRRTPARRLSGGCSIEVRAGGRRVLLRPTGIEADLDAGDQLRARACGSRPTALAAGPVRLTTSSPLFRPDLLRLSSAATEPVRAAGRSGAVLDPGRPGRGRYDGVRLKTDGPAWLVLGESFNHGWRAWCDDRDLGEPRPIDGYANGWPIEGRCGRARFAFAANAPAEASYWIGALVCLGLLAVVAVGWRRRRFAIGSSGEDELPAWVQEAADNPPRRPLRRALALGLGASLVCGFVFSLRAGAVAGPLIALLLWRGVGARALVLGAGALLAVVVPAIYVSFPPDDRGGFNSDYAQDLLGAHWAGVAAWLLLALALVRTLPAIHAAARRTPPAQPPPAPPALRPPPRESA